MNDQAPRDDHWVQAALGGDRDAFGQLVLRYQDRLFNSMLRILGAHEDAADAVQDALFQAFLKLPTFRGDSQFYTWLFKIATNVALSQRRRRKPKLSLDGGKEATGDEPPAKEEGPEEMVLSGERVAMVQTALAELPDDFRVIMVLREIEGFSYEEIAEIIDAPIGTVRSRLSRARDRLKEILDPRIGEKAAAQQT